MLLLLLLFMLLLLLWALSWTAPSIVLPMSQRYIHTDAEAGFVYG